MANFLQVGIKLEDGFSTGIEKALRGVTRFTQGLSREAGSLQGVLSKSFNAALAPIRAVERAIFSLQGALAGFGAYRLGEFAGKIEDLDRSFKNVAESIGSTADTALAKLRAATKGTVSDFNLMLSANRAVLLGAAQSDEELVLLADTARRLGRAMGRDVGDAFNDLSLGIARQSRLILDNIGIIVNVEAANEAYAASLGKSVEALTETERRQSFMNAVMRGAEERIAKLGGDVDTLSDAFGRFRASLANAAQDVIRGFTPLLTDVFERMARWFRDNQDAVFNFFIELAEIADRMIPRVISWVEQLGKALASALAPLKSPLAALLRSERVELLSQRNDLIYGAAQELGISVHRNSPGLSFLGRYSSDTPDEVLARLRSGQAGALDGAGGRVEYFRQARGREPTADEYAQLIATLPGGAQAAEKARALAEKQVASFLQGIEGMDRQLAENQQALNFLNTGTVPAGELGESSGGIFADVSATLRDLKARRQAQREAEEYSRADLRRQQALSIFAGAPPPPGIDVPLESTVPREFKPLEPERGAFAKGIDAAVVGLERLKREGLDTFAQIANAVVDVGNSLADNFTAGVVAAVEGTQTLSGAFRAMTKGILQDLTRILVRMAAVRLIGSAASALSGALQGPREIDSSLTDAQYQELGPRNYDYSTDPDAPTALFDRGGISEEPAIFAERRPEAAVPLIPGTRSIPVRLFGGTGGGGNVYNFINVQATDADSFNRLFVSGALQNKDFLASLHLRQYQNSPRLQAGYG